jgi:RimJ/RimL family protein N-acetyltransferase
MIRPFIPEDLINIEYSDPADQVGLAEKWNDGYSRIITLEIDGDIVTVMGITGIRPGVYEAFITKTEHIFKHAQKFHDTMVKVVEDALELEDLHRLQMYVDSTIPRDIRWAERLGFEREGLLKKFDIDRDYYIYGRTSC